MWLQDALMQELPWQQDSATLMWQLRHLPSPVFFDSSMNSDRGARYDILTACPTVLLTQDRGAIFRTHLDGSIEPAPEPDIFAAIKTALAEWPQCATAGSPFIGGAAGFIAYEAVPTPVSRIASIFPAPARSGPAAEARADYPLTPEAQVGIYHWSIVVDHLEQRTILYFLPGCAASIRDQVLLAVTGAVTRDPEDHKCAQAFRLKEAFRSNLSVPDYGTAFERLKAYIQAGDCYQANLAQRFEARFEGDPLLAYLALRERSRSPFSAYMKLPAGAILSLSPERFVQVREGRALTQPIKGTRRRGKTPEEDEALKAALLASEKDRAENLMIVDLLRNDLGSLCETGSVKVEKLFELQSFNSVHHLVSTISAQLGASHSALDLLRNCFPGGSITGAPKIRAMQIIRELEPHSRAIYCGSLFYAGFDGQLDSSIAIRTLLCEEDRLYCWGGGGIVADSDRAQEYQESCDKVRLLLNTLAGMNGAHSP